MNYKEFREKYGKLDRAMLKLMLGIGPSKYDRSFSSLTMQATGIGMENKNIVFDEKTNESIKMFLDLRMIKRCGENLYLGFIQKELRTEIKWGCIDDAAIIDLKSAKHIFKELQPNQRDRIKIKLYELVNVIK